MINQDGGFAFDLISSREKKDVVELLSKYPHIEKVTRDGSKVYAGAVSQALPLAIQISDRFHLVLNLTDALKLDLKLLLPRQIMVNQANKPVEEKRYSPTDEHNQETGNSQKLELITAIRNRFEQCPVYTIVQNEFGITYPTLKKYLTAELIQKKKSGRFVKNDNSFHRKFLSKLLYDNGVFDLPADTKTQENILKYLKTNRPVNSLIMLATEFRITLYGSNPNRIFGWIAKAKTFEQHKNLQLFVGSIENDIEAVQNAIIYKESNGVVEGCISKLKLCKKSMYGRCEFSLLKTKVLMQNELKAKKFYSLSSLCE